MIIVGTILIVLASIGIGLLIDRKWDVIPRKEKLLEAGRPGLKLPAHAPGAAPATALELGAGEIEKLRRKRCDECRGETQALADDHVTYDGRDLLVVHAECLRCGRSRSTYVLVRV